MGVIHNFIERNKEFASKFRHGDKAMPPAQHLAVLTCMDARIHPERAMGMEIGDAHMIRNAGGRASDDAIRSLVISTTLLGTQEFAVIHHTDCGMLTFTNDDLRKKYGLTVEATVARVTAEFGGTTTLRDSVTAAPASAA